MDMGSRIKKKDSSDHSNLITERPPDGDAYNAATVVRTVSSELLSEYRAMRAPKVPVIDAPPVDAPPVDAPPVDAPPVDAPPVASLVEPPEHDGREEHPRDVDAASAVRTPTADDIPPAGAPSGDLDAESTSCTEPVTTGASVIRRAPRKSSSAWLWLCLLIVVAIAVVTLWVEA